MIEFILLLLLILAIGCVGVYLSYRFPKAVKFQEEVLDKMIMISTHDHDYGLPDLHLLDSMPSFNRLLFSFKKFELSKWFNENITERLSADYSHYDEKYAQITKLYNECNGIIDEVNIILGYDEE